MQQQSDGSQTVEWTMSSLFALISEKRYPFTSSVYHFLHVEPRTSKYLLFSLDKQMKQLVEYYLIVCCFFNNNLVNIQSLIICNSKSFKERWKKGLWIISQLTQPHLFLITLWLVSLVSLQWFVGWPNNIRFSAKMVSKASKKLLGIKRTSLTKIFKCSEAIYANLAMTHFTNPQLIVKHYFKSLCWQCTRYFSPLTALSLCNLLDLVSCWRV